jgi:2-dehydropantoate 2-reductase
MRSAQPGETLALAAGRSAGEIRALHVEGEPAVQAPDVGETLPQGRYDLILLCTRTDASAAALAPAIPLLEPDGAVLCLQNGLPEAKVAALVGAGRTLGAVIGWSASAQGPGRYVVTGGGKFTLGFSGNGVGQAALETLEAARSVLSRVFAVRVTTNLAGARWSKLAINCAMSSLGAVSGLDLGQLAARRATRTLALRIVDEAVQAAHASGVTLEPVAGLNPVWLARDGLLQHAAVWLAARRRPRQRSGMLVRLLAGRPSGQVDDLNGAVVEAARTHGLTAPFNERLLQLVHAIERGEERLGPHQLERLLG